MAVGKYLPEANPGPTEDIAVTLRNLLEGLGGGSQLSHDSLDDVSPSDHHTKYTDSDAIGAIEGEATLDLTGDLSTPGSIISTGGGETGKFQTGSAGNTVFAFSGDNFDIRAGTGGSSSQNVMRVKSAGDFGIGTNNPGAKLEIRNAGDQLKLSFDGTDNVIFAVDTAGVLTITPSGAAVDFASKNITNLGSLTAHSLAGTLTVAGQAFDAGSGSAKIITTGAGEGLDIVSAHVDAVGAALKLYHNSASPADNDSIGFIYFKGNTLASNGNPADTDILMGQISCIVTDVTDEQEDAALQYSFMDGGAYNLCSYLTGGGTVWFDAFVTCDDGYKVMGTQVVAAQGAAVANATGAGDVVAQLNALLARVRAHGLIAT